MISQSSENDLGYLSTHPSLKTGSLESKKEWLRDILGTSVPADREARILEIGPGRGEALSILSQEMGFRNITAIDISEEVIAACKHFENVDLRLTKDTKEFLKGNEGHFDMVFMYHVLEHISMDDIIPTLKAIRRALKVGGCLVVGVPNAASPIIGSEQQLFDFTHRTAFSPWSLEQAHRMAGFERCRVNAVWPPGGGVGRTLQRATQKTLLGFAGLYLRAFSGISRPVLTHSMICLAWK